MISLVLENGWVVSKFGCGLVRGVVELFFCHAFIYSSSGLYMNIYRFIYVFETVVLTDLLLEYMYQ